MVLYKNLILDQILAQILKHVTGCTKTIYKHVRVRFKKEKKKKKDLSKAVFSSTGCSTAPA